MKPLNPLSLTKKNILVTGAASGIGRETCIILSHLGANLIMVDMNLPGLRETRSHCKRSDKLIVTDLTKGKIKESLLKMKIGKLHGMVHLAGKSYISPLKTIDRKTAGEIWNINTFCAIELAQCYMNKNIGAWGSIVFVSSIYASVGSPANAAYAMSKAALHGITKALSIELAPLVRVNCIAPGFVCTKLLDNVKEMFDNNHMKALRDLHPLGLGEPEDVSYLIAYLLSDASKWVTGSIFNIDGGYTAQ